MKLRTKIKNAIWGVLFKETWETYVQKGAAKPTRIRMGSAAWHVDFCADPFLFRKDGANWLFYETLDRAGKGVLGCFKEERGRWKNVGMVLEIDHHLSYPQVFEEAGEVYMIPESGDFGRDAVYLYRAKKFPFEWEKVAKLIDKPFVDSTLLKEGGRYYLACSIYDVVDARRNYAELWTAEKLTGPWRPHPQGRNVSQSAQLCRCGGGFLRTGGKLYRVAQDCDGGYGKRLFRVPVEKVSAEEYREGRAELLLDGDGFWTWGRHTYNEIEVEGEKIVAYDRLTYRLCSPIEMCRHAWKLIKRKCRCRARNEENHLYY